MRALAFLAVLVLFAGGLAGCVGSLGGATEEDPVNQTGVTGNDGLPVPGTGGQGLPAGITVRAPLASSLALDGPTWVASGTAVNGSVAAPANAKGAVTYVWALGPLPGTAAVTDAKADTGSKSGADYIKPGASKNLTFNVAGVYAMHCHPHAYMRSNVTVIDGLAPSTVDVYIVDGEKPSDSRYIPENVVVGKGSTVVYRNVGQLPHTATALGAQSPALKKLPVSGASGVVTVEGEGWQRVVVAMTDSEGRLGVVEKSIYVTATLPKLALDPYAFAFTFGAPLVPNAPAQPATPDSKAFKLEHPAKITLNYTFTDAVGSASSGAENLALVEIHLTPQGQTQDVVTVDSASEGTADAKVPAGTYTLTVIPRQGAEITGEIVITGDYELVPPSPSAPSAGGDSHGGHAH